MAYSPPALIGYPPTLFLSPASPEFAVSRSLYEFSTGVTQRATVATGTWPTANKPMAVEFWITEPITVYQLGWMNGSGTMTDSVDIGVYDSSYVRQIAGGGTARVTANAIQFVDVADTVLTPGRYRLAMACNGTTASQQVIWTGPADAVTWGMLGAIDSATSAYPLPAPLTNMATAATFTFVPLMFIAARSVV